VGCSEHPVSKHGNQSPRNYGLEYLTFETTPAFVAQAPYATPIPEQPMDQHNASMREYGHNLSDTRVFSAADLGQGSIDQYGFPLAQQSSSGPLTPPCPGYVHPSGHQSVGRESSITGFSNGSQHAPGTSYGQNPGPAAQHESSMFSPYAAHTFGEHVASPAYTVEQHTPTHGQSTPNGAGADPQRT
jgi:hypothetical protein